MEYSSDGYDYIDEYLWDTYPKLTYFTDWFDIQKLEYNYVFQDGVKYRVEKKIVLKTSNSLINSNYYEKIAEIGSLSFCVNSIFFFGYYLTG